MPQSCAKNTSIGQPAVSFLAGCEVEGPMVVQQSLGKLKGGAAFSSAVVLLSVGAAYAADVNPMVTKAPPPPAAVAPASCGSLYDFFVTAFPPAWLGGAPLLSPL